MSTHSTNSSQLPCPSCGLSSGADSHVCELEIALDWRMLELRDEIEDFERAFWSYLETAHGTFAQWLAARRRSQAA